MARQIRIEYPGALYHVMARGNDKRRIFLESDDSRRFLDDFAHVAAQQGWLCYAYCLLPNHYHLLLETPAADLSAGMHRLNSRYVGWFNHRHGRIGHLFQGRFKSILVDEERYFLTLMRYIAQNPVQAGLAEQPAAWRWSSCRASIGEAPVPPFLALDRVWARFDDDPTRAKEKLRDYLLRPSGEAPLDAVRNGLILGDNDFLRRIEPLLPPALASRLRRQWDRPSLTSLRDTAAPGDNSWLAEAHQSHGYSQREIAAVAGMSAASVNRAIKGP